MTKPDLPPVATKVMPLRVVMMGATGAVGQHVVQALLGRVGLQRLSLLGRRPVAGLVHPALVQQTVDIHQPATYEHLLAGHDAAVCTLGVGQPSKVSREEFVRVDKDAVLAFATAAKRAGVAHFELLCSVGADSKASSFYLRTKGELCDGLQALGFERLSIFAPSMILTPANRYGLAQGALLAVWPKLSPLLLGGLRKFRGVQVHSLGKAMAANLFTQGKGVQRMYWDDFSALVARG